MAEVKNEEKLITIKKIGDTLNLLGEEFDLKQTIIYSLKLKNGGAINIFDGGTKIEINGKAERVTELCEIIEDIKKRG